jgi:hypothetical protein
MDNATRHHRIARRFLVSLLQQYGEAAPVMLRRWADELEQLAVDERSDLEFDAPVLSEAWKGRRRT